MAEENKGFKKLFSGEGSKKLKTIICIVLFAIIVIIFISAMIPKKETVKTSNVDNTSPSLKYCHELEGKLENVLLSVKGIGKVKVFVMVSESPTYTYLDETNSSTSQGQSTSQVTIYETKNGSATSPVLVREELPEILGVLVVATGAKDLKMQTTLTNVIANVLSISISKVEVLEGKG